MTQLKKEWCLKTEKKNIHETQKRALLYKEGALFIIDIQNYVERKGVGSIERFEAQNV